jgi:hypothetical protein
LEEDDTSMTEEFIPYEPPYPIDQNMTDEFIPYEPPYPIFVIQFDQDGNCMGIFEDTIDRANLYARDMIGVNGSIHYVVVLEPLLFFPASEMSLNDTVKFLRDNGISFTEST